MRRRTLTLLLISAVVMSGNISAQASPRPGECIRNVLKWLCWIEDDKQLPRSSYSFGDAELAGLKSHLSEPIKIDFEGLSPQFKKLQNLVFTRYRESPDLQGINAFGTLQSFHLHDAGFSADIAISKISEEELLVDIPEIKSRSASQLGRVSQTMDVGMARFLSTAIRGVEYRLSLNPAIKRVVIQPSKVINQKLKRMLEDLGFTMVHQASDYGEAAAYRNGMGPPSRFELKLNVLRTSLHLEK